MLCRRSIDARPSLRWTAQRSAFNCRYAAYTSFPSLCRYLGVVQGVSGEGGCWMKGAENTPEGQEAGQDNGAPKTDEEQRHHPLEPGPVRECVF